MCRRPQPFARKRGFTVPVGDWIARRGAQLGPLVAAQPGVREICLPEAVETLVPRAGKRGHRPSPPGPCCSTRSGTAATSSGLPPDTLAALAQAG